MSPPSLSKFELYEEVYVEPTAFCEGFHTQIVGMDEPKWLTLKHPFPDSWLHRLNTGDFVWVRFFKDTALRFGCMVIHTIDHPIPLIFLQYPTSIQPCELRGSVRKKTRIPSRMSDPDEEMGGHCWEGVILDLSESGCLVLGGFVNLLDRDVLISFQIPSAGGALQTRARVVRCDITKQGIHSGLQFLDPDTGARAHLQRFIDSVENDHVNERSVLDSGDGLPNWQEKYELSCSNVGNDDHLKRVSTPPQELPVIPRKVRLKKLRGEMHPTLPPGAEIIGTMTETPKPGRRCCIALDSGQILRTSIVKECGSDRFRTAHSLYFIEPLDVEDTGLTEVHETL